MDSNFLTLGAGMVFFNPVNPDTGQLKGEFYVGNTSTVTLDRSFEFAEPRRSIAGMKIKTDKIATSESTVLTFITDNISIKNLGLWFGGYFDRIGATMDGGMTETVTLQANRWYQMGLAQTPDIGHRGLFGMIVTQDGNPITGLYYDEDNGRFGVPRDRTDLNDVVAVCHFERRYTQTDVSQFDRKPLKGALRFLADNTRGANINHFFPKVLLYPKDQLRLKDDTWMSMSFEAEVLATQKSWNLAAGGASPAMLAIFALGATLNTFPAFEAAFNSALNGVS